MIPKMKFMKTKLTSFLISGLLLAGLLVLISLNSCRKQDSQTYNPVPPGPTPDSSFKEVFTESSAILTEQEVVGHKPFLAGRSFWQMSRGNLLGGPFEWFEKGLDIYSTIDDFRNEAYERKQFAHIDSALSGIQNQLTQIQGELNNLATLINKSTSEIMAAVYDFGAPGNAGNVIANYFDPPVPVGNYYLTYYTEEGTYHSSGSSADSAFIVTTLNSQINGFAQYLLQGPGNVVFGPAMTTLANVGLGKGEYTKPAVELMANYLLELNSSTSTQNLYLVMENYFLQLLSYQFQGMIINANLTKAIDSTQLPIIISDFDTLISQEIRSYLKAATFMALFADYRSPSNWTNSGPYRYYGIEPDYISNQILQRSRFIANMLYAAISLPYPVVNGYITLPHYYNTGTGTTPLADFSLTFNGSVPYSSAKSTQASAIPYIYWQLGENNQFFSDNQWNQYIYGSQPGATFTAVPIQIALSGNTWGGPQFMTGKITPMWYNPRNPQKGSAVKTDSCVVQMAFFSSAWRWGYPAMCHATQSSDDKWNLIDPQDNVGTTSSECHCPEDPWPNPCVLQFHSSQCIWETGGSVLLISTPRSLFEYYAEANIYSYSGGQVYFIDGNAWSFQTPSLAAGMTGISLFTDFNYSNSLPMHHQFVRIGTNIVAGGCGNLPMTNYNCKGDIYNSGDAPSLNNMQGTGISVGLTAGSSLQFSYEIEAGVWEEKSNLIMSCNMNIYPQPVVLGYAGWTPL
jgi:hypothetical protein